MYDDSKGELRMEYMVEGWMNALLDGWINGWPHHTTTQLSIHLPGPDTAWT